MNPATAVNSEKINPIIWFDIKYLKETPGSFKLILVVINLLAFISACAGNCSKNCSSVTLFSVVSMLAFWTSLILLTVYLFHLVDKYKFVPWNQLEIIYCISFSIMYFVFSFFIILQGGFYAAAGFFGFIATFLYGMDGYLKYLDFNRKTPDHHKTGTNLPSNTNT